MSAPTRMPIGESVKFGNGEPTEQADGKYGQCDLVELFELDKRGHVSSSCFEHDFGNLG